MFGGRPAPQPASRVRAVRHDEAMLELARRLPSALRFGTVAWACPAWDGLVYERPMPEALLVREGLVHQLAELYDLAPEQLVELPGFAEKSATALVAAIAASATPELARFLYGLGVPEIGVTVARDLARHFGSFAAVFEATDEALQEVAGIGPRMAEQFKELFDGSGP